MPIDARTLRDVLADPGAAETFSAASGCPLVVVDADDPAALADVDITALPAVVVLLAPDPGGLPTACFAAADVILTSDESAPAPFVRPEGLSTEPDATVRPLSGRPIAIDPRDWRGSDS